MGPGGILESRAGMTSKHRHQGQNQSLSPDHGQARKHGRLLESSKRENSIEVQGLEK